MAENEHSPHLLLNRGDFADMRLEPLSAQTGAGEFNKRSSKASAAFFEYVTGNALVERSEQNGLEAARGVLVDMIKGRGGGSRSRQR